MNIEKQNFNTLDVLYDDKKWGKRIDPDEWNANFKVLEEGHNELVGKLNRQITDIDNAIQSVSEDGGSNVKVNYGGGSATLQGTVDNIVTDIENRYTKAEVDATIGSNTNSLLASVEYNESTGVFTFIKKDGSRVVFDTVIEKVPASMALKEETDGSVWLVITNQDGSQTKTNVTSLIEDTVVIGSNTVNVDTVTDAINKVTRYTLTIKPNSIGLSHMDTELTSKFEETQTAKNLAVQAKDNAVSAKNASETAQRNAETFANNAETSSLEAQGYAEQAKQYANSSQGYTNQSENYKNSAELAKVAAEKARDEAKEIVGGDFATKSYVDSAVTGLATEEYVQQNGGKIDSISVNGASQTIDENKNVNIDLSSYVKNTELTAYDTHISNTDIHTTAEEKAAWNESDVFVITISASGDIYSCDKTYVEIKSAFDSNKVLMCNLSNCFYTFDSYSFNTDSSSGEIAYARFTFYNFDRDLGQLFLTYDSSVSQNTMSVIFQDNPYTLPDPTFYANHNDVLCVDQNGNAGWFSVLPKTSTFTLLASGWNAETSSYSLESSYSSSEYDIEISLDGDNATDEQINAWIAARMLSSSSNKIIAKGTIPTIDIPILLTLRKKIISSGGGVQ